MSEQRLRRQTVEILICEGLGYCCEYAFFRVYRRTSLSADRLGVTRRAVGYHKAAFDAGELKCEGRERCLKGKLFK